MSNLDQITCKNKRCPKYPHRFVFRQHSEMDTAPVPVSCPECWHVYLYEDREAALIHWPDVQGPQGTPPRYPTVTLVPLICGKEDCDNPRMQVLAPRQAGTPKESVLAEVPRWTLHDVKCPNGHPILVPKTGPDDADAA